MKPEAKEPRVRNPVSSPKRKISNNTTHAFADMCPLPFTKEPKQTNVTSAFCLPLSQVPMLH